MARKPTDKPQPPASYGGAVAELERLITDLEGGQLPLEDLLGHYRRGTELLDYCRAQLQVIEDQIKVLDESGAARPWQPE